MLFRVWARSFLNCPQLHQKAKEGCKGLFQLPSALAEMEKECKGVFELPSSLAEMEKECKGVFELPSGYPLLLLSASWRMWAFRYIGEALMSSLKNNSTTNNPSRETAAITVHEHALHLHVSRSLC